MKTMKRSYSTPFLLIALLALTWSDSPGEDQEKASSRIKRYEIEKACVEYKMIGMLKGTETVYFADWGNDELTIKDVVMEIGPMKQRTHTATYTKGDKIYTVDLETKKGTVMENPMLNTMTEEEAKKFGEEFLKQLGKEVGTEEFLTRTCRVFEMPGLGSRVLIWKNLALKSETGLGTMNQTRAAAKITFEFDKKVLELPTDIDFEKGPDLPNIMKMMKRN